MLVARPGRAGSLDIPRTREAAGQRKRDPAVVQPGTETWQALANAGLDQLSPPEAARILHELEAERERFLGLLGDLAGWPARSMLGPRYPEPRDVDALGALPGRWRVLILPEDDRALRLGGLAFERTFILDPLWDCRQTLYGAWHRTGVDPNHVRQVSERALTLLRAGPLMRCRAAALAPDYLPRSWDPFPGAPRPDPVDTGARRAWAMARALTLVYLADRLNAAIAVSLPEVASAVLELVRPGAEAAVAILPDSLPLADVVERRDHARRHLAAAWKASERRARPRRSASSLVPAMERLCTAVAGVLAGEWNVSLGLATLPTPATILLRARADRGAYDGPTTGTIRLARPPLCLVPLEVVRSAQRPAPFRPSS